MTVAIYARVSTEEQRDGQTIDSQIRELEQFASNQNWVIHEIYKDEGWSGGLLARPALDKLRDDCSKGVLDAVLVNDVDRLARDVSHLGIIKRDIERKGVRLVFRKLPAENSPTYNLMVNILGSFAEFERELIADRTRRGRRHKVEVRHEYVGCTAPFGYRYLKGTRESPGHLEVVPEQAKVVEQIYRMAADESLSMKKIAERLTAMGARSAKGNPHWGVSVIGKILRDEVYAGTWYFGRWESREPLQRQNPDAYRRHLKTGRTRRERSAWLPVHLPKELAILPRELWERTQRQVAQHRKFSPRRTQHFYMLQGMLRCGRCNARFRGRHYRDGDRLYFYYHCAQYCRGSRYVRRDRLDSAVWDNIQSLLVDPEKIAQRVRAAAKVIGDRESSRKRLDGERVASKTIAEELAIFNSYRQGRLSAQRLASELQLLRERREAAAKELATAGPVDPASIEQVCSALRQRIEGATEEEKQTILRDLGIGITVTAERLLVRGQIVAAPPSASASAPFQNRGHKGQVIPFDLSIPIWKCLDALSIRRV